MGAKKSKPVSTELSIKELEILLASTSFTEQEIRNWHKAFIRDCPTGRLDKKSFTKLVQEIFPKGKIGNFVKFSFRVFDDNKDGFITFDEFLLRVIPVGRGALIDRLSIAFDLFDTSSDGRIDQKELTNFITAIYDVLGETKRTEELAPKFQAEKIIECLDTSTDKKISKVDFVAGLMDKKSFQQLLATE